MDVNGTDHSEIHTNSEAVCWTSGTNTMFYVNYTSMGWSHNPPSQGRYAGGMRFVPLTLPWPPGTLVTSPVTLLLSRDQGPGQDLRVQLRGCWQACSRRPWTPGEVWDNTATWWLLRCITAVSAPSWAALANPPHPPSAGRQGAKGAHRRQGRGRERESFAASGQGALWGDVGLGVRGEVGALGVWGAGLRCEDVSRWGEKRPAQRLG